MTTREEVNELLQTSERLKEVAKRLRKQQRQLQKKIRGLKWNSNGFPLFPGPPFPWAS